jgi:hypothetical protein
MSSERNRWSISGKLLEPTRSGCQYTVPSSLHLPINMAIYLISNDPRYSCSTFMCDGFLDGFLSTAFS